MAVVRDIEVYRGEDIRLGPLTHDPVVDISSWTIVFTLRKLPLLSSPVLATISAAIISGPNATFEVLIAASVTLRTPDEYWYDIWRTNPGGEAVLAVGKFIIKKEVRK